MSGNIATFPIPRAVELDEKTATNTYGKFTIAPLQSGFGILWGIHLDEFCFPLLKELQLNQ